MNQEHTAAPTKENVGEQVVEGAQAKGKPYVSWGAFAYKWATYFGVDTIFNTLCGVAFAFAAKYTGIGKKLWSGPLQQVGSKAFAPLLKTKSGALDSEALKYCVDKFETFFSIIAGGMFTIPPLMMLEKKENRVRFSRAIDETIYGKEKVASDPKFEASYRAIEEEPPKQFWAGMFSRFAALAPLLAWVLIPKSWSTKSDIYKKVIDAKDVYFGKLGSWFDKGARALGVSERNFKSGIKLELDDLGKTVEKPAAGLEKFEYITKAATPMDFGLGIPYAILHGVLYPVFAKGEEAIRSDKKSSSPVRSGKSASAPDATISDVQHHEKMAISEPELKGALA